MDVPEPRRTRPPTVERLRADIDEGKTGEKVRYPDPAAAPLGSDDEAAGTPSSGEQRRRSGAPDLRVEAPSREAPGVLLLYALLIVGAALVIIGTLALLRM